MITNTNIPFPRDENSFAEDSEVNSFSSERHRRCTFRAATRLLSRERVDYLLAQSNPQIRIHLIIDRSRMNRSLSPTARTFAARHAEILLFQRATTLLPLSSPRRLQCPPCVITC